MRLAPFAAVLTGCDAEPPLLTIDAPQTAWTSPTEVEVVAEDDGVGVRGVWLRLDDRPPVPVPDDGTWTVPVDELEDGPHELVAGTLDWLGNDAAARLRFEVDTTPPDLVVDVGPVVQGRTTVVWIESSEPLARATVSLDERVPVFAADHRYRALLGIPLDTEPGPAIVVVHGEDRAGHLVEERVDVEVQDGQYLARGRIRLTRKQVRAREDEQALAQMRAERDQAYAWGEPRQRWDGAFTEPMRTYRRTSPFGAYRTYSDGRRSHHTGLDLTWRRGSSIHAVADGVVRVAGQQPIFGKVVIVGHGQGVASSYNHLSRTDVDVGERVEAGQQVGIMGSTGQSTGPHLHLGVTVHGVAVDPAQWLDEDPSAP